MAAPMKLVPVAGYLVAVPARAKYLGANDAGSGSSGLHNQDVHSETKTGQVERVQRQSPKRADSRQKQGSALREAVSGTTMSWESVARTMSAAGVFVTKEDLLKMANCDKPFEIFHMLALPLSVRTRFIQLMEIK